jgi:SAM-dependent methyltransferase
MNSNKRKPSKPLIDMLAGGVINGSFLEFGSGRGNNVEYLASIKPNTMISGFDPNSNGRVPTELFDTIFCNNLVTYTRTISELSNLFRLMKNRLKPDGKLIITARSIAEVKGNVNRNTNWTYDPILKGYESKSGVFQRGYDNAELDELITLMGFTVVTDHYNIGPRAYSYTIAQKK